MSGIVKVPVLDSCSPEEFRERIGPSREPVVLRGLDLGPCPRLWSPEYLQTRLQPRTVRVHVGQKGNLDFRTKNFKYCDLDIRELVRRAQNKQNSDYFLDENEVYYLRKGFLFAVR